MSLANDILIKIQKAYYNYMQDHNVQWVDLDCRIYIDVNTFREFLKSQTGKIDAITYEFCMNKTLRGFKVYQVICDTPLLDVVVREYEH